VVDKLKDKLAEKSAKGKAKPEAPASDAAAKPNSDGELPL